MRLTVCIYVTGSVTVDLTSKLPWNGAEYIPPRQHVILQSTMKIRQDLADERMRKMGRDILRPASSTETGKDKDR